MRNPAHYQNAVLSEENVWKILLRLHAIKHGNPEKDSEEQIAADFRVGKKAISRVRSGETWKHIKERFDNQHSMDMASLGIVGYSDEEMDLLETTIRAKEHFGLQMDMPLHYGAFDWIDGLHHVVSDEIVMWESQSLYKLAVQIEKSGIDTPPLFARKVSELPTFAVSDKMTMPFDDRFVFREHEGDIVRLGTEKGCVVKLHSKYMQLVDLNQFDVYQPTGILDFVYLTKSKIVRTLENVVVHACVATLE